LEKARRTLAERLHDKGQLYLKEALIDNSMGFRSPVRRSTLAEASLSRDWHND
jgi:hypothetical protein